MSVESAAVRPARLLGSFARAGGPVAAALLAAAAGYTAMSWTAAALAALTAALASRLPGAPR